MPPSSLLIAVDMESLTALGVEPHFSAAAVYLDLHLFGCDIHVHIDHFPRCHQLKSLLEKFGILHGSAFLPYLCVNQTFRFWVRQPERGTSAALTKAKDRNLYRSERILLKRETEYMVATQQVGWRPFRP